MDDRYFATYGEWNLEEFSRVLPDQEPVIVVASVRDSPGHRGQPTRVGELISDLWARVRASLPLAAGHRAAWGELWFLVPGMTPDMVVPVARAASTPVPQDLDLEIWLAVSTGARVPAERLARLEELAMATAKIRYRKELPNAFCILNGSIVHRPA